ncbi:DUF4145 domain-containing protein [Vibrio sp. MA40-2]|uniref:DUF4145 domain-containing protein n=1 Tax=Vibrio sp. MA40-2 TaxID=3391828 RepID=UPI0039A76147
MSDIEEVVKRSRRIEKLLRVHYHADGKGLHQLITSCEERLPHDMAKKLRYIATIRNKIVHEDDYKLEDNKAFFATCDLCEKELTPRANVFIWRAAILVMLFFTLAALGVYAVHWDKLVRHL